MIAVVVSFLAALALSLGTRDSALVKNLGARLGLRRTLSVLWLGCAMATLALAAGAASIAAHLPEPARRAGVALALIAAGLQCFKRRPLPEPAEPTRSFGAITLVLLALMTSDPVRLTTFALALHWREPGPIAASAGCGTVMAGLIGARLDGARLAVLRRAVGAALIGAAIGSLFA